MEEQIEKFKTRREFDNKYPSKIYVCSRCGEWIGDRYNCKFCGETSNKLFLSSDKLYRYQIAEESPRIIFQPIERLNSVQEKN